MFNQHESSHCSNPEKRRNGAWMMERQIEIQIPYEDDSISALTRGQEELEGKRVANVEIVACCVACGALRYDDPVKKLCRTCLHALEAIALDDDDDDDINSQDDKKQSASMIEEKKNPAHYQNISEYVSDGEGGDNLGSKSTLEDIGHPTATPKKSGCQEASDHGARDANNNADIVIQISIDATVDASSRLMQAMLNNEKVKLLLPQS